MVPPTSWSGRQQKYENTKRNVGKKQERGRPWDGGVKRAKQRKGQERRDIRRDMGSRNRKTKERTWRLDGSSSEEGWEQLIYFY